MSNSNKKNNGLPNAVLETSDITPKKEAVKTKKVGKQGKIDLTQVLLKDQKNGTSELDVKKEIILTVGQQKSIDNIFDKLWKMDVGFSIYSGRDIDKIIAMKNKFKFPEVFESQEFKKRVESAIEHHLYLELNQHDYVHINEAKAIMRIFKCVDSERLIANIIDNYLRVGRHDRFDCIVKIVDNFYIGKDTLRKLIEHYRQIDSYGAHVFAGYVAHKLSDF